MSEPARSLSMQPAEAAAILGLGAHFSAEQIKSAHRRLARQHHPDLGGDADTFRRVQEAFECLRGRAGDAPPVEHVEGRPISTLGNRDRGVPDCAHCAGKGFSSVFLDARRAPCRRCRGFGIVVTVPCKFCQGAGCRRCKHTGRYWLPKPGTCFACNGIGWKREGGAAENRICTTCDGSGQRQVFNPVIPRGAILR